jgi:1-aminocyclopropane-1-carboxylate deaminase/D-cysteine desulfhydrase-like pyridoxal-dependent ACC family enzyme
MQRDGATPVVGRQEMDSRLATLRRALAQLPRARVATLPTPLERAPRLAQAIGARDVLVKRDDLTGLALGGNKTRQLELILGAAMRRGATAIVSQAGRQSNQSRQLAAAAARLGLELRIVVLGEPDAEPSANDLVCGILGAQVRYARSAAGVASMMVDVQRELEHDSHVVHVVDVVDHRTDDSRLGAVAYAECAVEMAEQLDAMPTHVFLSCGTGSSPTLAGIAAGFAALGSDARVIGVPASPQPPATIAETIDIAVRALSTLDDGAVLDPGRVVIENEFAGSDDGATPESIAAMRLAVRTEGLLCDPIYTGKALAALVRHAQRENFSEHRIVFLHTGGTPLLFLPQLRVALAGG